MQALLDLVGLAARNEFAQMGDDLPRAMHLGRGLVERFVDGRAPAAPPSLEQMAHGEEIVRGRRQRLVDLVRQSAVAISAIELSRLRAAG